MVKRTGAGAAIDEVSNALSNVPYYHPYFDEVDSAETLARCPTGTFLIRPSSQPRKLTLSIRGDDYVHHTRIHISSGGLLYVSNVVEGRRFFACLPDLVLYYSKCKITLVDNDGQQLPGSPFRMKHPLDRECVAEDTRLEESKTNALPPPPRPSVTNPFSAASKTTTRRTPEMNRRTTSNVVRMRPETNYGNNNNRSSLSSTARNPRHYIELPDNSPGLIRYSPYDCIPPDLDASDASRLADLSNSFSSTSSSGSSLSTTPPDPSSHRLSTVD